jgi:hypothetical protein
MTHRWLPLPPPTKKESIHAHLCIGLDPEDVARRVGGHEAEGHGRAVLAQPAHQLQLHVHLVDTTRTRRLGNGDVMASDRKMGLD